MKHKILMTLVALFAMTTGAWADEATITLKCGTTEKTYENVTLPWSTTADILKEVVTDLNFNVNINAISGGDGKVVKYGNENFTVTGTFSGDATVTVSYNMGSSATITVTAPGPLLTLNEAKTEATMESMPTYDVTVDYELVRDMEIKVGALMPNRIRIQQNEGKFVPVIPAEIIPAVTDNIDSENPVTMIVQTDYTLQLQKKGENDTWTDVEDLSVGNFRYVVTGANTYDGIIYTNTFMLYQGYEVVVPAGEYVTYYKDEALKVEDEEVKLYTVSSIDGDKAMLSDGVDAMKANTPMLVKNNGAVEKTVLLIPCNEPDLAITVADQFLGTLENKTFTDTDMANADYYVCNGKKFIKVEGAGTLGANMAYLKFVTNQQQSAPQYISIMMGGDLGEGTTNIDASLVNSEEVNSVWYDLNGRKLNGKPSQKGIYIKNGKKVIVK